MLCVDAFQVTSAEALHALSDLVDRHDIRSDTDHQSPCSLIWLFLAGGTHSSLRRHFGAGGPAFPPSPTGRIPMTQEHHVRHRLGRRTTCHVNAHNPNTGRHSRSAGDPLHLICRPTGVTPLTTKLGDHGQQCSEMTPETGGSGPVPGDVRAGPPREYHGNAARPGRTGPVKRAACRAPLPTPRPPSRQSPGEASS